MSTTQHYSFIINLSKNFLKKTHAHPLIAEIKGMDEDFYDLMWESTNDLVEFRFGGTSGTQFTSPNQIKQFITAFNALLVKKTIDQKHRNSLLYLVLFLNDETEKQSMQRNHSNKLKDYADFLTNIFINCMNHLEYMSKKKDYRLCYDKSAKEFFFAKIHLIESLGEDLPNYVPELKNENDIVRYLRIDVCEMQIRSISLKTLKR